MKRTRLAVIGFGKVGERCAHEIRRAPDLELAGIVRRPESVAKPLPQPLSAIPVRGHISELGAVEAALVCVPAGEVLGVAKELLQRGVPVVECALLSDAAFSAHRAEINRVAETHRIPAVVGAGWERGGLGMFRYLFELLIPEGHTDLRNRPGISLHHTAAAEAVRGVKEALCAEQRGPENRMQRYVYVELEKGADPARVAEAIRADPLFLGEDTLVFPVDSVAALEEEGHGVLLQRFGTTGQGPHASLILETRFDPAAFTARLMVDAARRLPGAAPGAHVYSPLGRGGHP